MTLERQADADAVPATIGEGRMGTNMSLKSRCTISKEDLERAMAVTPIARRKEGCRNPLAASSRTFRWPTRHVAKMQPAEIRGISAMSHTRQEGGSKVPAKGEESISLVAAMGRVQQQTI